MTVRSPSPESNAVRAAITAEIRQRIDLLALAQEATGDRMRPAGSEYRGPCPLHEGSGPNFCVSPGKGVYRCWVCDAAGDVFTFVQQWRGISFPEARDFLAVRAGVALDWTPLRGPLPLPARLPAPRVLTPQEQQRAEWASVLNTLRDEGCAPHDAADVYAAVLALLQLEQTGADYLAGRGLDPSQAESYGFRSVPSHEAWSALRQLLVRDFLTAEIGVAGLHRLPWAGSVPALLIPYIADGAVVGLRFRNLAAHAPQARRYWSLAGVQISTPFNADALTAPGDVLHLVEGELNAWTLSSCYGLRAIGLPGAASWRPEWSGLVAEAIGDDGRFVAWYDNDDAGTRARAKLAARLEEVHGREWLSRHCLAATPTKGDPNDLHRSGELAAVLDQVGAR